MTEYKFDGIEELQRKPDIEGKIGSVIDLPGGRWLRVLAASDNNPKWVARRKIVSEATRRMSNADVSDERYRKFMVPHLAEALVIDWGGIKTDGVEIPFSVEACKAFLMVADDAFTAITEIIYDNKKFRGDRIEVIVENAGN